MCMYACSLNNNVLATLWDCYLIQVAIVLKNLMHTRSSSHSLAEIWVHMSHFLCTCLIRSPHLIRQGLGSMHGLPAHHNRSPTHSRGAKYFRHNQQHSLQGSGSTLHSQVGFFLFHPTILSMSKPQCGVRAHASYPGDDVGIVGLSLLDNSREGSSSCDKLGW